MISEKLAALTAALACVGLMGCEAVVMGSSHSIYMFNNPSGSTITIVPSQGDDGASPDATVPANRPTTVAPIETQPLGKDQPVSWHHEGDAAPYPETSPLDTGIWFVESTTLLDHTARPALTALGLALGAPSLQDQHFAILARVEQHEVDDLGAYTLQMNLAHRRALAIREALIAEYGVDAVRLVARAWNASVPWADSHGDRPSHVAIARFGEA